MSRSRTRRRNRWRLVGLPATLLVAAACGPAAAQRGLEQPDCTLRNNSVLLMAQAVPTARFVPCIAALPAGWNFESSDIERGRARFFLESDRAGPRALEVTMTEHCRPAGTEIPSDQPEAREFVHLIGIEGRYRGTRYYLVPGGCITYGFDFPAQSSSVLSTDASIAVGTVRRGVLERAAEKYGYHL